MNRKHFEIYKEWREKKYQRELERLQEDLANRGLASSGIRKKEEKWLRYECEADISRRKAEMEDYEEEKKRREQKRRNMICTNRILAGAAIISVLISAILIFFSSKSNLMQEKQLLPQFEVNSKIEGLNTTSSSESIIIQNQNQGATCNDLHSVAKSFLEVGITENSLTKVYLLPLEGYFNWGFVDGCKNATLTDHHSFTHDNQEYNYADYNYAKTNALRSKISAVVLQEGKLAYAFPLHFIKLTYQDIFGQQRTEYYKISVTGENKILNSDGDDAFRLYDQRKHFNLSSASEEILDYLGSLEFDHQYSQEK